MVAKPKAKKPRKRPPEESIFFTREEGWQILDEQARELLGMSGEEFVRAWEAGEIDANDPRTHTKVKVIDVVMLLPLAR